MVWWKVHGANNMLWFRGHREQVIHFNISNTILEDKNWYLKKIKKRTENEKKLNEKRKKKERKKRKQKRKKNTIMIEKKLKK